MRKSPDLEGLGTSLLGAVIATLLFGATVARILTTYVIDNKRLLHVIVRFIVQGFRGHSHLQ